MYGKHRRKEPKYRVFRLAVVLVLAVVLSVSSFGTVMANTVSANVIDGDKSYTFNMESADLNRILAQAQKQGLTPLGPLDVAEQVENTTTVNIRRGVSMSVVEGDKRTNLIAFKGDSVEKTLADNNIILKDGDMIVPARETVVSAGLSVEIRRFSTVRIMCDGETKEVALTGGTVSEALALADITPGENDKINYDLSEPLFNNMVIRVVRTVRITVTVDGETKEYTVSAVTVADALEKCGVTLGEDDRLNVERKAPLTDGMTVEVTRVSTEEITETEFIERPTQYIYTNDMYEDQAEVRTAGEDGEKEVTYKLFYIDGELDGREIVSENVTKEPVPKVVVKGTKVREGMSGGGAGTFIDMYGNVVSYNYVTSGPCTAYYPLNPGDITSTGVVATYGCIAVDPRIIPYGTRLYVTSADGSVVYGYGVACDTGGAAMDGDIICDLCYDTEPECSYIGRRNMLVYILN